jgi:hypothetical protein
MTTAFRFDFGRITVKDRPTFMDDLRVAFRPPAGMSAADADQRLMRWLAATNVAGPGAHDWTQPATYAGLSVAAFTEVVRAFGAQFRRVLGTRG